MYALAVGKRNVNWWKSYSNFYSNFILILTLDERVQK